MRWRGVWMYLVLGLLAGLVCLPAILSIAVLYGWWSAGW